MKNRLKNYYSEVLPAILAEDEVGTVVNRILSNIREYLSEEKDSVEMHENFINTFCYGLPLIIQKLHFIDPGYFDVIVESLRSLSKSLSNNDERLKSSYQKAAMIFYIAYLFYKNMDSNNRVNLFLENTSNKESWEFFSEEETKRKSFFEERIPGFPGLYLQWAKDCFDKINNKEISCLKKLGALYDGVANNAETENYKFVRPLFIKLANACSLEEKKEKFTTVHNGGSDFDVSWIGRFAAFVSCFSCVFSGSSREYTLIDNGANLSSGAQKKM